MENLPRASVSVVIPTRNREKLLTQILEDLSRQSLKPKIVVVIDSSDTELKIEKEDLNLVLLDSTIRSAAVQRNMGLDYLEKSKETYNYCAFLDDDIRIDSNYLNSLSDTLNHTRGAVGISGLAISVNESSYKRNRFLDLVGYSGPEGSLTRGAINVPVRKATAPVKVEWLIGCSLWDFESINSLRFEEDFMGQSLFEDVLFSVQASKFGFLIVDSNVRFTHHLAIENRPDDFEHYSSWVCNRFRLKRIFPEKFSMTSFVLVNLLVLGKLLVKRRFRGTWGILTAHIWLGLKR